ncbi:hypothetical protein COT77_02910 [Candidatus Berkelbacteria bacterium CG10_big_fil_rev_8_21_14_0_10_41_12]|uniref:J domain-containing protein n=1 Tax=Candidatus Berkelbacteria bacterium CG10_big_fil_rev_8_21_14_0_10_41_12 TaxID=1974513 RepID=A0A2M6WWK8_9BACT|nr:MAG: hypothetical protein COT77_02910 [Candidatus Berkelbacteria bacterium CG10_big_fil_rev_8_21_14_0_10_41_12]
MEDYYKILGVSKNASSDEIKKAYRKLAMQHHPDRGGEDKEFKKINEAYQILSDPQKRAQYDQFGRVGDMGGSGGGYDGFGDQGNPFSGFEGFSSQDRPSGFDFSGFGFSGGLGDIFETFFSDAFSTVQAQIEITPAQAVLGDKLKVQMGKETIDVEIPAGVQDGTQFRVRGKGKESKRGRGDLILQIKIKMPNRLTNEQRELWEKLHESENQKKTWWQR